MNPVLHSDAPDKVAQYRVEPYVVAADVYSVSPFNGQGGWTWYTGSSGWMYRLGLEGFLGLKRQGAWLELAPCIPHHWPGFHITYRFGAAVYEIQVDNPSHVSQGVQQVILDGTALPEKKIPLLAEAGEHRVSVVMG